MGASIEQNGAGRGQAWHKAVQEKEKGKWWEKKCSFCQCLPGTEEGSVNLVNHVVATEHRLGHLSQSRLLQPHKLTEPRAVV